MSTVTETVSVDQTPNSANFCESNVLQNAWVEDIEELIPGMMLMEMKNQEYVISGMAVLEKKSSQFNEVSKRLFYFISTMWITAEFYKGSKENWNLIG